MVIVVGHAVVNTDLVTDESSHLSCPPWVESLVDHALLGWEKDLFVAFEFFLCIHYLWLCAGGHQYDFTEMLSEELFLLMGESVEHLCRSLVITDVGHLRCTSDLFDLSDEGWQIIGAHLSKGPIPLILLTP